MNNKFFSTLWQSVFISTILLKNIDNCSDTPPDQIFTCEQQLEWGKCSEAWIINGNFCQKTCGRCNPGICGDVPPTSEHSCEQQAKWGKCDQLWMIQGQFCQETCARCFDSCIDVVPPGGFTCGQQANWGKCNSAWMINGNYCQKTCGNCVGLNCNLATSLECDRLALQELKAGMSQQAQAQLSSWNSDNPCLGWKGIICRMVVIGDSQGLRVNRIRLGEFIWEEKWGVWGSTDNPDYVANMNMQFPKIVSQNMVYLEEISLWNCGIQGSLPLELSSLKDLQIVALGENNVGGSLPKQFSTWSDVQVVQMQGMGLTGRIPPEFSSWSQLRSFNARFNNMGGNIPVQYSEWVSGSRPISLQSFFMQQNGLCTTSDQVSTFTKRPSLSTDIQLLNLCQ